MIKKLIIDKEGKVTEDGVTVLRKDINNSFLDSIFQSALKNEVDFEIDESDPISILFKRIKEETASDSLFVKKISGLRQQYKENIEERTTIENTETDEDLPF
jgi:hypothetical protein